jgi:hypothetical protein
MNPIQEENLIPDPIPARLQKLRELNDYELFAWLVSVEYVGASLALAMLDNPKGRAIAKDCLKQRLADGQFDILPRIRPGLWNRLRAWACRDKILAPL